MVEQMPAHAHSVVCVCVHLCVYMCMCLIYVTEFWKITHMVVHEIIRIFMFGVLLIRAGNKFKNISRIFL